MVVCEFGGLSLNLVGALFDLQWLGNLSWLWVVVCNGHGSPVVVLVCYGFFFFFFLIWVFGGGGFAMGWLRVSLWWWWFYCDGGSPVLGSSLL